MLDSTNPDLSAFQKRGGKMIVTIGTNDTLASPGAQLDYYQAVMDKMGRRSVDRFARLFVMPQTGHGLSGTSYTVDGTGKTIPATPIPNRFDQPQLLFDWVEKNVAPPIIGRRQRGRPQPAAVLVSGVSALCDRTDRERGVLSMYAITRTRRRHHVSTRRHHHDHHTHRQASDRAHRGPVAGRRPSVTSLTAQNAAPATGAPRSASGSSTCRNAAGRRQDRRPVVIEHDQTLATHTIYRPAEPR